VTLAAGQDYVIGAYYQNGNESLVENVLGLDLNPDFTIVNYLFAHPGYYDPGMIITAANGNPGFINMFGPDFLVSAVPEPSTMALIGLGATALIFRRRS
jgi:hypothetical protein